MNKTIFLLLLLMTSCCKIPDEPSKRAYNQWVHEMQGKENLQLVEIFPDRITFQSNRRVGIGEARRMMVRIVRSLRKTGNEPGIIRIMYKECDKMRKFHYYVGYIAEVIYSGDQLFYGMMGNQMQCVHREDFDVSEGRAFGYPSPPFIPDEPSQNQEGVPVPD